MKVFSAKQFHETPKLVYKAAMKGAVKITHNHLGESFILVKQFDYDNGLIGDIIATSPFEVKFTTTKGLKLSH